MRQACSECRDARHIHSLLAFRHGATDVDVLDLVVPKTGNAPDGLSNDESGEVVGSGGGQLSFRRFAYRCSDGGYDDYIAHV